MMEKWSGVFLHRGSGFKTHIFKAERGLYLCAVRGCRPEKDTTGTCSKVLKEAKTTTQAHCVWHFWSEHSSGSVNRWESPVRRLLTTFRHIAISISCSFIALAITFFLTPLNFLQSHSCSFFPKQFVFLQSESCCENVPVYMTFQVSMPSNKTDSFHVWKRYIYFWESVMVNSLCWQISLCS